MCVNRKEGGAKNWVLENSMVRGQQDEEESKKVGLSTEGFREEKIEEKKHLGYVLPVSQIKSRLNFNHWV